MAATLHPVCWWRVRGAEEKTRPDQPEPNARIDESEDAGEFRLISLAAFRDKDRVHLRERLALILSSPEG